MLNCKIKQIGNSVGIIIPNEIARGMSLKPETEVIIEIRKKGNPLKDLFGALPEISHEDVKKARKDLESKFF